MRYRVALRFVVLMLSMGILITPAFGQKVKNEELTFEQSLTLVKYFLADSLSEECERIFYFDAPFSFPQDTLIEGANVKMVDYSFKKPVEVKDTKQFLCAFTRGLFEGNSCYKVLLSEFLTHKNSYLLTTFYKVNFKGEVLVKDEF